MNRIVTPQGACEISSLPGQGQVAVCHNFFIRDDQRGQGHAHTLKSTQRLALQAMHYDYAIVTVASGNAAEKAVLAQSGWQKLTEFRNRRSSETTEMWGYAP